MIPACVITELDRQESKTWDTMLAGVPVVGDYVEAPDKAQYRVLRVIHCFRLKTDREPEAFLKLKVGT